MKRFVFVEVDRYEVVDSKIFVFVEDDGLDCRKVLIKRISELWGYDKVEEEYGDRIEVRENVCGLDLEEVSYLVKEIW
jgi:hypothetical protein